MNPVKNLQDKIAFVQGGSRGIGAAIVKRLASEGAAVAFTYQSSTVAAEKIVSEIVGAGGNAIAIQADSANPELLQQAIRQATEHFGGLDILVNNAGILPWGPLEELTLAQIDLTLAINVRSVIIASQEATRHMRAGGRIINIGSINADRTPIAGGAVYAMSKASLVGFTKGLARDLGPRSITVNNVQPGPVETDMNPASSETAAQLKKLMALGRYGKDSEIASFVAYLAGPEAAYITGASLSIDGGFSA
ncbi:3-oxoacyl-ACP reductase family protein [Pseudomonas kielensis]|jgi:3-oxoacyl-[acyl-carrier protein] reductase|uniref:3-oxoacyl-ACP reductase FabG n=1 Tax=Pseudomonas kielensis TaxID=2762577 RepID=A0A7X1KZY0_9PSED|nr:3-oxoacyl-ACP reductase family protein [Pseudomonas kielensis]MBC2692336.1 3-oxoacyl-ACP reductase FabG [Pseudomonas kielensis]WKL51923.1 3-oxoacyl-ACP reductase family protein [Pseudomonas kielensis]